MTRIAITVIVGSLILMVWSALSWMLLPFHEGSMKTIPESAINTEVLKQQMPEDGVYHYPGMPEENSEEAYAALEEQLSVGPRITLMVYKSGGTAFFDPVNFLWDFIYGLITVVLIFGVIRRQSDKSMRNILWTTISIGLVIGLMTDLPLMNWFMFPADYALANVFDYIIALGLLGLFLAGYTFRNAKKIG